MAYTWLSHIVPLKGKSRPRLIKSTKTYGGKYLRQSVSHIRECSCSNCTDLLNCVCMLTVYLLFPKQFFTLIKSNKWKIRFVFPSTSQFKENQQYLLEWEVLVFPTGNSKHQYFLENPVEPTWVPYLTEKKYCLFWGVNPHHLARTSRTLPIKLKGYNPQARASINAIYLSLPHTYYFCCTYPTRPVRFSPQACLTFGWKFIFWYGVASGWNA